MATDLNAIRGQLERINEPETRWELGEDARRAILAALAEEHLLSLVDECARLRRVLYPHEVTA